MEVQSLPFPRSTVEHLSKSRSVALWCVFDLKFSRIYHAKKMSKSGLLMYKTSSIYLYVKLNRNAKYFLPAKSRHYMNSTSYEYSNISALTGVQFHSDLNALQEVEIQTRDTNTLEYTEPYILHL